eukprot:scaffold17752_cov80-Skeletonema_marinoi.AAC.3
MTEQLYLFSTSAARIKELSMLPIDAASRELSNGGHIVYWSIWTSTSKSGCVGLIFKLPVTF